MNTREGTCAWFGCCRLGMCQGARRAWPRPPCAARGWAPRLILWHGAPQVHVQVQHLDMHGFIYGKRKGLRPSGSCWLRFDCRMRPQGLLALVGPVGCESLLAFGSVLLLGSDTRSGSSLEETD